MEPSRKNQHRAKRTVKRPEGQAELPGFQSENRAVGEEEMQIGITASR